MERSIVGEIDHGSRTGRRVRVLGRGLAAILGLAAALHAAPAWSYASDLDQSFGRGGLVREPLAADSRSAIPEAVAVDAAGRLVLAGNACDDEWSCGLFVTRFAGDGTRDLSFGVSGVGSLAPSWCGRLDCPLIPGALPDAESEGIAQATSMALDAQGRIVVAGYLALERLDPQRNAMVEEPAASRMAVARFLPSGLLDTSFGSGGLVKLDAAPGALERAEAVAVDAAGRIVVAGWSYDGPNRDVTLLRLRADGSLDAGFGNFGGGIRYFGSADVDEYATAMTIDRYGRIVAAAETPDDFLVVRFRADGTPDLSFGPGNNAFAWVQGKLSPYYVLDQGLRGIAVDSNGRILVVVDRSYLDGTSSSTLLRLMPDGRALDPREIAPGYDLGTYSHTFNGGAVSAMAVDSRDRVVVAGPVSFEHYFLEPFGHELAVFVERSDDPAWSNAQIAYNTPDTLGFAEGLSALVHSVKAWKGIAVDPTGRVVVVGYDERDLIDATQRDLVVARYLGEPFQSWGSGSGCPTCSYAPAAVCGNGLLEFGEGCDDDNTRDGDACSAACEVEPDDDGDGLLDEAYDYCVNVGGTQEFLADTPSAITLGRSTTAAGTSETLTFSGVVQMPSGWSFASFDPTAPDPWSGGRGVELMVANGVPSRILSAVVADDGPDRVWTRSSPTLWHYENRFPEDGSPIVEVQIADAGAGKVSVLVRARKSQFVGALGTGFDPLPLQGAIAFGRRQGAGQVGECGEVRFAATECAVSASGASVACRRPTPAARPPACGIGPELALLVPLIEAYRKRLRARREARVH
jgi:uncharacterized delta-60 repeat protein